MAKKCESCAFNAENKSALKEHQQAEHGIVSSSVGFMFTNEHQVEEPADIVLGGTSFRPLILPSDPPFSLNISIDVCVNIFFSIFRKSSTRFRTVFLSSPANTGENLTASSLSISWLKLNALTSPIQVLKSELLHILTSYHFDCRRKTELWFGTRRN